MGSVWQQTPHLTRRRADQGAAPGDWRLHPLKQPGAANLLPFVKSMIIDKNKEFTARRIIKRKTGTITIFTDHFGVKVTLAGLPKSQRKVQKESTWNYNKPGGWDTYEQLTNAAAERVKSVVEKARV